MNLFMNIEPVHESFIPNYLCVGTPKGSFIVL